MPSDPCDLHVAVAFAHAPVQNSRQSPHKPANVGWGQPLVFKGTDGLFGPLVVDFSEIHPPPSLHRHVQVVQGRLLTATVRVFHQRLSAEPTS